MSDKKPVIFISYSHKDEPDKPAEEEVQWLSFVRTYLQPAVKHGVVDLFDDQRLVGGAGLDPEIEKKLRTCDVFLLLISAHSLGSNYIFDTEIRITRERQSKGEDVHFYPLLLTPTPKIALDKLKDMVIRPKDAKPLSAFPYSERIQQMNDVADEIAAIAAEITRRKPSPLKRPPPPAFVHVTGLPETAYENLVGRETELKRLDEAWADRNTNILSLIAEGGAGKSALVNEWLKILQVDNYRGAEAVLGWSFYSQGTKERATSAEQFLSWAMEKLDISLETTSASAKGEAIAEALAQRRVLLVLDGCEPLQHGLDKQQGELKDQGLRALLRRFASMPPADGHGLVVLTSRLLVKDIVRWRESAAPLIDIEKLSEEAGAALLRDNGVWGTDKELRAAARDFGGHPLALGLLASFLKETYLGDVRQRDRIRGLLHDDEDPRHDHARRVMESYDKEWLTGEPIKRAIMHMVGLFDRPASGDCLLALRTKPAINGLTDAILDLQDSEWRRAVARLREVRLLAPTDPAASDALDAHPLVREWFGVRLKQSDDAVWKAAHGRLYEHLRDATKEGRTPALEGLAPLYQAIAHGCRADRHHEALHDIYINRICRRDDQGNLEFYTKRKLGAFGSDLAAVSWFFDKPYETPVSSLKLDTRTWLLGEAATSLRAQGRFAEALPAQRTEMRGYQVAKRWHFAAISGSNLSEVELLVSEITAAIATADQAVRDADQSADSFAIISGCATHGDALLAAGKREEAERLLAYAEERQRTWQPHYPLLYSLQGYIYCDLLLDRGDYAAAHERATKILEWEMESDQLLDRALVRLTVSRCHLGRASKNVSLQATDTQHDVHVARVGFDAAIDLLRAVGEFEFISRGLLARSSFRRIVGDWEAAARDLDEVEEIAEPGPMRLLLCDMVLQSARLAFAKVEAFAPLNGLVDNGPPKPVASDAAGTVRLKEEAAKQLVIAADLIKTCGYHRRDEELAELEAVLRGERRFADLPPKV
jgi:hypothetical protein